MRTQHVVAAVLSLGCALLTTASCLTAPPETDAAASPSLEPVSERPSGTEPIGEAQQADFDSTDFPFVVQIDDDGLGKGGGWQRSIRDLTFGERERLPFYTWECPVEVGMPVRGRLVGRITGSRASMMTAEIANNALALLWASRPTWRGQGAAFCVQYVDAMNHMFRTQYGDYGAKVKRP